MFNINGDKMKKLLLLSLFLCNGIRATEDNSFTWTPFSHKENDELDHYLLGGFFQENSPSLVNAFTTISQDEQNFLNHLSQETITEDPFLNELQETFSLDNNNDVTEEDLNVACSSLNDEFINENNNDDADYDNHNDYESDNELDEETHHLKSSAIHVDNKIEKKSRKIFECTHQHDCKRIFDTEQHLKDHIVAANNTKPFKCFDGECKGREEFNRYNFLSNHLKKHHKIDSNICLVCSIKCKTDHDLLLHKRTLQHKDSLKKVYEDDTEFIKEMNEKNHLLLSEEGQKEDDCYFAKKRPKYGPRLFLCHCKEEHPCQKTFPSQYSLIQHLNDYDHSAKNKKHTCKACKQIFTTSWTLNRHKTSAGHQKNIETLKKAKSLLSNTSED